MSAVKGSANSLGQLMFGKSAIRLDNTAFSMRPFGLNRVEPRAFDWQEASQNAHTFSAALDAPIMFSVELTRFSGHSRAWRNH